MPGILDSVGQVVRDLDRVIVFISRDSFRDNLVIHVSSVGRHVAMEKSY